MKLTKNFALAAVLVFAAAGAFASKPTANLADTYFLTEQDCQLGQNPQANQPPGTADCQETDGTFCYAKKIGGVGDCHIYRRPL